MEQAVSLLGSLSPAELEQLSAKVAALRALSGPAPISPRVGAGLAAFGDLLYAALAEALEAEQGVAQPPYASFLRTKSGPPFLRGLGAAERAHAQWFPKASTTETAAVCRIYARCLLEYVKARALPANWRTVSSKLTDLPAALDCAFPGYARNGTLSVLLRHPEAERLLDGPAERRV